VKEPDELADNLKQELGEFELEQEDLDLLELELGEGEQGTFVPAPPVLAVVGRPNVGKSLWSTPEDGKSGLKDSIFQSHSRRR